MQVSCKTRLLLLDIHQIIEVPHAAQELLASERTPTLSMALPAYELLQTKWTELKGTIWELAHYIEIGLDKLTNYIHQARKTRIYALAMSPFKILFVFGILLNFR